MSAVVRTMKNLVRQVSKRESVFLVLGNYVGPCDNVCKGPEVFLNNSELTGLLVLSDSSDYPFS